MVLSGQHGSHPELPNLHDIPGLRHLAFGDFEDDSHYYRRADSPTGTRFYIRREKGQGRPDLAQALKRGANTTAPHGLANARNPL